MHLCIFIPVFNQLAATQAMLETLLPSIPSGLRYEIVFINDHSTDGTTEWLQRIASRSISAISNPMNLGYARSNNLAARISQGDVFALLNNDLLLQPGWLEPMLNVLQSPIHNVGMVGNIQLKVIDGELDHAGVEFAGDGALDHVRIHPLPDALTGACQRVFAVSAACCVIRRADFESVGGFDEGFINGGEDIDICMRIRALGKQIYVANDSRVLHHVSLSRDIGSLQMERNSRRLYDAWRPEFKNELARTWTNLFERHDQNGAEEYLDGRLSRAALAAPHGSARLISEALLRRQEARWQRELDGVDQNYDVAQRSAVVWPDAANTSGDSGFPGPGLVVKNLQSARNFYVCGYRLVEVGRPELTLTIEINGIQLKSFDLGPENSFNFGVIDPIILPLMNNRFALTVDFIHVADRRAGSSAASFIAVTHFVVDDHVVACARCSIH